MEPARWERLQELFQAALDLVPAARESFVEESCSGDPTLGRAVLSLLRDTGGLAPISSALREELLAPAAQPGERIGPYRVEREIGHGGMGEVYLAVRDDAEFEQRVAVKLLRGGFTGGEVLARFRAERQILAGLAHPNIARLLDGGRHAGLPYLVMEYVLGQPISDYCAERRLPVAAVLGLFRDVCAAVHYAHQNLVVHRDIKPGNVLVSAEGVPKLLDFGIAKLLAPGGGNDGATRTHVRLFTPEYASPEQLEGRPVTTASDVYALGILLYELLTGQRPERGKDGGELRPPSAAAGPAGGVRAKLRGDVDTIVLRALEREPARRYASAEQMAEDVRRYLDGEDILARRPGPLRRLIRRARKNRGATALVGAAVLLAAVASGLGLAARASARSQARLAAEFAQSLTEVEWLLRVARMAPAHDISPERAVARARLAAIGERMRDAGPGARGPGEYALGRGALALEQPAEARQHLESAWAEGYRTPDVAYALGLALGAQYQAELQLVNSIGSAQLREARRREVQAAYRDPAVAYLRQGTGGTAVPDYVQGLLALYEKRYAEARSHAESALRAAPWLYEARLLAGDVEAAVSQASHETGNAAASATAVAQAEASYRAAALYARSDARPLAGLCQVGVQRLEVAVYQGHGADLAEVHGAALAACRSALALDPQSAVAMGRLTNVQRFWATHLRNRGLDPLPALSEAAETARRAIDLDPKSPQAHGRLGVIHRVRAEYEASQGRLPDESLRLALVSLQAAVDLGGGAANALNDLANVNLTRALATVDRSGDPTADLEEAVRGYGRALEKVPDFGYAVANRGEALLILARTDVERGRDPRARFEACAASLTRAAQLLPRFEGIQGRLLALHALSAEFGLLVGQDAALALERAQAQVRRLEPRGPRFEAETLVAFGALALRTAQDHAVRGRRSALALDAARVRLREALSLEPRNAEASRLVAETDLMAAILAPGPAAAAPLARAARALEALVGRTPGDVRALALLSEVRRRQAEQAPAQTAAIAAGLAAADAALALAPDLARARGEQGVLLRLRAERARDAARRHADARLAVAALEDALRLNGHLTRRYEPERARAEALARSAAAADGERR